jgi:hypothetical protein
MVHASNHQWHGNLVVPQRLVNAPFRTAIAGGPASCGESATPPRRFR